MPMGFPICVTLCLHTRLGCQSVRKTGSNVLRQNIHMASLTGAAVMMACVTLLWSISEQVCCVCADLKIQDESPTVLTAPIR